MHIAETELAALTKKVRMASGKTRAEAARDMGIKQPSVFHAEESPHLPYTKLRRKMIEAYSSLKISGPFFRVDEQ
jgi:DNA-binding XRE family transcriptional regulator